MLFYATQTLEYLRLKRKIERVRERERKKERKRTVYIRKNKKNKLPIYTVYLID